MAISKSPSEKNSNDLKISVLEVLHSEYAESSPQCHQQMAIWRTSPEYNSTTSKS